MRVCFGREFPFEKSSNFAPILWLTVDRETKTQTNQQCVKDSAVEPKLHLPAKHQPDWEIVRLAWTAWCWQLPCSFALMPGSAGGPHSSMAIPVNADRFVFAKADGPLHFISPLDSSLGYTNDIFHFSR